MRILAAVSDLWLGSNSYGFIKALRRRGHSVQVVTSENFVPLWRSKPLRAVRRAMGAVLVREYTDALLKEARDFRPHLLFVFKGTYVAPEALQAVKSLGAVAINFYPDVGLWDHGKYIPRSLPLYDWIFTTKSFGVEDMRRECGVERASFLPHGFDPDLHRPIDLDEEDLATYESEVSFIGTCNPKKQAMLESLRERAPRLGFRIWGNSWDRGRSPRLAPWIEGRPVTGLEYAKAIGASKINLALLIEARPGGSSGDKITSRTFHIPAAGGFMLHERTDELQDYFREGEECACFGSDEELWEKIAYYLAHDDERRSIAEAGRRRCLTSDYSIDARAGAILEKVASIRGERASVAAP